MKTFLTTACVLLFAATAFSAKSDLALALSSAPSSPAFSPYQQMAFAENSQVKREVYIRLTKEDKLEIWQLQLQESLVNAELNAEQRQLINQLLNELPEIILNGKESKSIEGSIAAAFPDDLRRDVFVNIGSGGREQQIASADICNCSYGSYFNTCSSCKFYHIYVCALCLPTYDGCGFLAQYECNGACNKPAKGCI